MFGSSNIQSSWANPQQNQQQQQQPNQAGGSVFGQPSTGAFGATPGAFGGGGAFGQQQQPPQQQNSVFGAGNNTGGGAFGAFGGANSNNQSQTGGLFGAAKPATTGFGAFGGGGTNAFGAGGGGAFGTPANTQNTTNTFGSTSTTGAFGNAGGVFGAKPSGVFGTATTPANPNTGQYDGVAPVTTGSSNPPYSVFSDKDAANPTVTLQYQSITCMPQYRGTSFEELRWQDYQQGRKTASTGGFGTTPFGQTQSTATGGVFGAAQPAQNNSTGFSAFGGGTTGGAFGQQNNAGGAFGGGAFGQQNQQQQQPAATGFGAFGQNNPSQQQPATGTGLFGSSNTGAFGAANNNQAKPFGGGAFGATGTGAFGATNTNPGGGLFGQNNQQQQQQPAAGGLFGQSSNQQQNAGGNAFGGGTGAFGQTKPPGGLFGSTTGTTGFGTFGANNQQQTQQQPAQTGGLFGAANNAATAGSGLFGQTNQNQSQPAAGGLFGAQNNNQQQPATGAGLFGQNNANNAAGGGLFGQNNQNQQQQGQTGGAFGGGGLFGAKPAVPVGGGLFGSTTNNAGGGLFGQNNANANPGSQPAGGGLFGASTLGQNSAQPAQGAFGGLGGGSGLFGAKTTAPAQPAAGLGNSTFGQTLTTSQLGGAPAGGAQAPSLQPSISQPVATNLPIFSMLSSTPGTSGVNLDQSTKKKSSLFEAPISQPKPHVSGYQPTQSQKLRGYASSMRASTPNGSGLNFSLTAGKPNVLNFSVSGSRIGPDAFTTSAVQGSGASKSSVKKLILDKKVDPTELLRRSSSSPAPGRASFNPALSIQHREREASAAPQSPAPAPKRGTRFVGPTSSEIVDEPAPGNRPLQEGDYWCRPSLQELQALDFDALSSVDGLVVGRVGYGQIEFLDPVDLTTLTKLSDLFGSQVAFETMECSVYPDSEDVDKPPPGSGLNVRARITLLRCYVLDKATRQPIKDEKNERAKKHVARLRSMPGTTFDSFSIEDGKWTFTVEHF